MPDVIVQPQPGVISTTSTSKAAEHGGANPGDRNVALLVVAPGATRHQISCAVSTTQVAPSALAYLGWTGTGCRRSEPEDTTPLPGWPSFRAPTPLSSAATGAREGSPARISKIPARPN